MRFRSAFSFLIVSLILCLTVGTGHAQDDAPVIIQSLNNLIAVNPNSGGVIALTDFTAPAGASFAAISPDARFIAYNIIPPNVVETLNRVGGVGGGALPSDIWMLEIATGSATPIATQPPDASFLVDGVPDKGIARALPTWSPDGDALAWSELSYPGGAEQLMVYDLASGESAVVVDSIPPSVGVPVPPDVRWGEPGILVRSTQFIDGGGFMQDQLLLYAPDGTPLTSLPIGTQSQFPLAYIWLYDVNTPVIGVLFNDLRWITIEPMSGSIQALDGTPELYGLRAGGASLRVRLVEWSQDAYTWGIYTPADQEIGRFSQSVFNPDAFSISPDGSAVAVVPSMIEAGVLPDTLFIYRANGDIRGYPIGERGGYNIAQVVWGPTAWLLYRAGDNGSEPVACNALTPRLFVGGQGRVLPGDPNNLRSVPGITGRVQGIIPGGAVFSVIGGPECGDGFTWWLINYNGITGWTAEGDGIDYWVEPAG
ncbi:MAG: SH3 domain-containing protein [Anaerolineae bacterium]|nr:SH3 domain-containing protein [Anaerolineae bacterium]